MNFIKFTTCRHSSILVKKLPSMRCIEYSHSLLVFTLKDMVFSDPTMKATTKTRPTWKTSFYIQLIILLLEITIRDLTVIKMHMISIYCISVFEVTFLNSDWRASENNLFVLKDLGAWSSTLNPNDCFDIWI
jgi:hypothetical protein